MTQARDCRLLCKRSRVESIVVSSMYCQEHSEAVTEAGMAPNPSNATMALNQIEAAMGLNQIEAAMVL